MRHDATTQQHTPRKRGRSLLALLRLLDGLLGGLLGGLRRSHLRLKQGPLSLRTVVLGAQAEEGRLRRIRELELNLGALAGASRSRAHRNFVLLHRSDHPAVVVIAMRNLELLGLLGELLVELGHAALVTSS